MIYLVLILVFVAFVLVGAFFDRREMTLLAQARGEPDICQFARSFDFRTVDTKIIRGVWNELQGLLGVYNGGLFPIEADDSFGKIYKLDPDDLDDVAWVVMDKLHIDSERPENNPYWNRFGTVRDLVMFLHYQPRRNT